MAVDGSAMRRLGLTLALGTTVSVAVYVAYKYIDRRKKRFLSEAASIDSKEVPTVAVEYAPADQEEALPSQEIDAPLLPPQRRLLVLGLDQSGKSSLLAALAKHGIPEPPKPTDGFNVISIQTGGTALDVWEIGGASRVREYWPNFIKGTDALVFVVDSASPDRLPEAQAEMQKLLVDERLHGIPLVIVANKQDLPSAESPGSVLKALGLMSDDGTARKVHVLGTEMTVGGPCFGVEDVRRLLECLWQ